MTIDERCDKSVVQAVIGIFLSVHLKSNWRRIQTSDIFLKRQALRCVEYTSLQDYGASTPLEKGCLPHHWVEIVTVFTVTGKDAETGTAFLVIPLLAKRTK